MNTPVFGSSVTVGGVDQSTRFDGMPNQIITRQSGQLDIPMFDANDQPFDITGLNGTDAFVVPYNTAEVPVTLGTGVISYTGEIFTLTSVNSTAGTFTLTVNGETTGTIAFDADEADVLAALEALASRSPGDFNVLLNGGSNLGDTGAIMEIQLSGSFDLDDRSFGTFTSLTETTGITFTTSRDQSTVQNFYSVTWVKDTIPASYSTFDPEDRDGSIAIFIELEEAVGDFYQIYTRFNVTDGNLAGNQQTLPLTTFLLYYNLVYSYDNTTTDADPGAGKFRMNNTTLSSVTEMYFADDSEATVNMSSMLQALDTGSTVYVGNPNIKTSAGLFTLTGTPVNNTGYTTLPVSYNDSGTTSFTNGEFFSFSFDSLGLTNSFADGSSLNDDNGNELLEFGVVASAVNHLKDTNAITATNPKLSAVGDDANISLELEAKGTGTVLLNSDIDINGNNIVGLNIIEDTTPQLGGFLDAADNRISSLLGLGAKTATTLTIATGAVTQTQLIHEIGTQAAAAADDLDSIVPATGQNELLLTMTASGQVPTVKHATGTNTFLLASDTDLEMVMNTFYHFHHDGTNWKLVGSSAAGGGTISVATYQDQKTSGTDGGSSSAGVQTRTLNTEVSDIDSIATLSANAVTPISGTYLVRGYAPCYNGLNNFSALHDGTSNVLIGTASYSGSSGDAVMFEGVIITAGATAYTIEHYIASAVATNGLGVKHSQGTEVYAQLTLIKIG